MYYLSSLLAFAALIAAQGTGPTIATPAAVVQCQPAQITYVAANSPVFISIIPGGQPSAAPLQDLGSKSASPFTWVANIPSGTQITFQIRDSTGAVAYSAPVTIQSSSDASCLGAGASSASSSGASASSTAAAGSSSSAAASASSSSSSAAAVTSSVAEATSSIIASVSSALSSATAPATTSRASSSVASTSRTATATSAATSPSTTPNSARSNMQVGFAGLVGLAAAAVLA